MTRVLVRLIMTNSNVIISDYHAQIIQNWEESLLKPTNTPHPTHPPPPRNQQSPEPFQRI